jgi:ribosome maturation factor RimP
VDFELPSPTRLEVFIDSDSGVTFEKCRKISRYLEAVIEEENWFGEKYTLDVSSPGLTRPLKLKRQYVKNIGRKLDVTLKDGEKKKGQLIKVEDEAITLEETLRVKEGKKKVRKVVQSEIPFETIKKSLVVISFK